MIIPTANSNLELRMSNAAASPFKTRNSSSQDPNNPPPLCMTAKNLVVSSQRVTLQDCEVCGNAASNTYCELCGYNYCLGCISKRINNLPVCDYCFLKEFVKKSPLEKEEMFRSIEESTQKMNADISQYEDEISVFKSQISKLDRQQSQMDKTEDVVDMENKIKSLQEKYASRKQGLEERKQKLREKKGDSDNKGSKGQNIENKLASLRLEISQKQAIQLTKLEQLEKLKVQMDTLDKERKEVMKDLDG